MSDKRFDDLWSLITFSNCRYPEDSEITEFDKWKLVADVIDSPNSPCEKYFTRSEQL